MEMYQPGAVSTPGTFLRTPVCRELEGKLGSSGTRPLSQEVSSLAREVEDRPVYLSRLLSLDTVFEPKLEIGGKKRGL